MFFLALSYIKILKIPKKILIIIQRSNGDVYLSLSLINALFEYFNSPKIDLLVNDDTLTVARLLPHINFIHTFSYKKKQNMRWSQEKLILKKIYRKYDLSINLTASDRSVIYAFIAAKKSISPVENDNRKSWWKKFILTHHYFFDVNRHILINNLEPLNLLQISHKNIQSAPEISDNVVENVKKKLKNSGIKKFVIFHPSSQYRYKVYPTKLRNELLNLMSQLNIGVIVTGGKSEIDLEIKNSLPKLDNFLNLIGETSMEEYIALSNLSQCYIGMDTLNMHIAASQNKRIFAIFGPTNLRMWSPWSNYLKSSAIFNQPIQTYDNVTIFQAEMSCVACGMAGCNDNFGNSDCLDNISPKLVFDHITKWYKSERI